MLTDAPISLKIGRDPFRFQSHMPTNAETVLNEDHYGLEKVKDRILEYLAVQQRVDKLKAPFWRWTTTPGSGNLLGSCSQAQSRASAARRYRSRRPPMAPAGWRPQ